LIATFSDVERAIAAALRHNRNARANPQANHLNLEIQNLECEI
jgi:hypothetical protein